MSKRISGLAGAALLLPALAISGTVCDLVFPGCPDRFASGSITVPDGIIAISPRIPACQGTAQVAAGAAAPSIVFIIDNSNSMGASDPEEMRFAAVANLLDDIRAISPSAEAGLVVFSRRLQFDNRDPGLLASAFPGDTSQHDAYVPLTALDQVYPDGRTGLDTLKALLRHDNRGNLIHSTRMEASRENRELGRMNLRDGTDLTLAFLAAKAALSKAKAAPSGRYFVLLSDGEPASPDVGREAAKWDFVKGAGVPTTFTVSFDSAAVATPPDSMIAMTNNVRSNGYSAANLRSTAWAMGSPALGLQRQLRAQLFSAEEVEAFPDKAVLQVGTATNASTGVADGSILFAGAIPLSENETEIRLAVTYAYTEPGAPATSDPAARKQKTNSYAFTVKRSPVITELPGGLAAYCREQPVIGLYDPADRSAAPGEISAMAADQTTLSARLTMPAGVPCSGCMVELTSAPAAGGVHDRETMPLASAGGYLAATFVREMSGLTVPGDGRLQHLPGDSLILTWRNPSNPLDRVRRTYPFISPLATLGTYTHNDFSRTQGLTREPSNWLLVGSPALRVAASSGAPSRTLAGPLTLADSLRYVGVQVEASRSFQVDIRVYDNLGQFVNKLAFSVPPSEFSKLPAGPDGRTRRLTVLWDNRSENGAPAGTGTYVLKSTITLDRLPGLPGENAGRTEYRRVGVLRSL